MNLRQILFLTVFWLVIPVYVEASVIINEIAWMGGVNSANHEWIELYNNSNQDVTVDGWTLEDGVNLNINLIGTIASGAYVVLERTSEDSSPALAFLLYTGALVNTGATLTLRNAEGQIMDQVAGGENWQNIGGDNTTKDTAQYTTKGWVTDTPTPAMANGVGRVEVVSVVEEKTGITKATKSTQVAKTNNTKTVNLSTPESSLLLRAEFQEVAYVNQTISFLGIGSGIGDTLVNSLVYTWNFGDSYSKVGREVEHAYAYPGTYVVTVNAQYAKYSETIRREITVLPVTFSITKNDLGDVQINNDSPYDVDMSGFVLRGAKEVVLPSNTIILPKATITIAKNRIGGNADSLIVLYDTKKTLVASTFTKLPSATSLVNLNLVENLDVSAVPLEISSSHFSSRLIKAQTSGMEGVSEAKEFGFVSNYVITNNFPTNDKEELAVSKDSQDLSEVNKKSSEPLSKNWPYIAFISMISLALIGLYFSKK